MLFKKGTLVKLAEDICGYEVNAGTPGFVSSYCENTKAYLISLDKPIDGSYEMILGHEELEVI